MGAPLLSRIELLYERQFTAFVRVARGIVGDRERALEAVHDGFADAIRGREGLRDDAALDAWVWRSVVDAGREGARRPLGEGAALGDLPSGGAPRLFPVAPA